MKKHLFLIGLTGAVLLAGCQSQNNQPSSDTTKKTQQEVKTNSSNSTNKTSSVSTETSKDNSSPTVKKDDTSKDSSKTTDVTLSGQATQAVQNFISALKNKDINAYKNSVTSSYNDDTSDQISEMFKQYNLNYDVKSVTVQSATKDSASVVADYRTSLVNGDPNSFSNNEATILFHLVFQNGMFKINSQEVLDVKYDK